MTTFDEQLAQASPQIPVQSPELDAERMRVIALAESAVTRRSKRNRSRVAIGGLAAVALLGAGGTAAAAGLIPWFESASSEGTVTTSAGAQCTLTFGVKPHSDPTDDSVGDRMQSTVVAAAERYLQALDVSKLSPAEATKGASERPRVDSEAGPALSVDQYEVQAVYEQVSLGLNAELATQGLPSSAVSLAMASTCGTSGK